MKKQNVSKVKTEKGNFPKVKTKLRKINNRKICSFKFCTNLYILLSIICIFILISKKWQRINGISDLPPPPPPPPPHHHHHHQQQQQRQGVLTVQIPLTLSHHLFLSTIALSKSSRQHPVSAES